MSSRTAWRTMTRHSPHTRELLDPPSAMVINQRNIRYSLNTPRFKAEILRKQSDYPRGRDVIIRPRRRDPTQWIWYAPSGQVHVAPGCMKAWHISENPQSFVDSFSVDHREKDSRARDLTTSSLGHLCGGSTPHNAAPPPSPGRSGPPRCAFLL